MQSWRVRRNVLIPLVAVLLVVVIAGGWAIASRLTGSAQPGQEQGAELVVQVDGSSTTAPTSTSTSTSITAADTTGAVVAPVPADPQGQQPVQQQGQGQAGVQQTDEPPVIEPTTTTPVVPPAPPGPPVVNPPTETTAMCALPDGTRVPCDQWRPGQ